MNLHTEDNEWHKDTTLDDSALRVYTCQEYNEHAFDTAWHVESIPSLELPDVCPGAHLFEGMVVSADRHTDDDVYLHPGPVENHECESPPDTTVHLTLCCPFARDEAQVPAVWDVGDYTRAASHDAKSKLLRVSGHAVLPPPKANHSTTTSTVHATRTIRKKHSPKAIQHLTAMYRVLHHGNGEEVLVERGSNQPMPTKSQIDAAAKTLRISSHRVREWFWNRNKPHRRIV